MTEAEAREWIRARWGVSRETLLAALADLVREECGRQNLIAAGTLDHLWARHIVDSAQLLPLADKGEGAWLDIGTGAGFPGMVVACLHDRPITLCEPRKRRADFRAAGATATDHGHPTARTANLSKAEAEALFRKVQSDSWTGADAELFRAQMLTEMAAMSAEDGMVMQIHPGACRNHNEGLFHSHGRDKGADIPTATDYVHALKPLLDRFGNEAGLAIVLFTLDESAYSRELAPLAGHYPCLKLGPAWWFHDSPEGMRRFREMTTETAGFYNTVGFNDDTRAFLSIPARHDVARRCDCAFLARLVAEGRLADWEAEELAGELAYGLVKHAYNL